MQQTSLTADLRFGDLTQALVSLKGKGVQPDDFASLGTNPAMLDEVAATILKHRLFTPPEEQVKRLLAINEAIWKDTTVTEAAIRAIGDPPECPPSDEKHLWCVTLVSETGDALATFARNWAACVHVHGEAKTWKWDGLVLTPQGVRRREGAKPRPAGLRWVVSELGRSYKGQKVKKTRPDLDGKSLMGMGQELPAIGALHPRWVTAMNGDSIPFVDAPDLEVAPGARGEFDFAPCLNFGADSGRVKLHAGSVDAGYGNCGSGFFR